MEHPDPAPPQEDRQRCALTGEAALPSALLCFVISPDGRVVFDIKQNLPVKERFWLLPRRSLVEQACAAKSFGDAEYAADLADNVQRQLLTRLQETLSLLRRSGGLVSGFDKVKSLLQQGRGAALVQASDAAVDGREKLAKLAFHHHIPVIELFPRALLAAVTGQDNQTHLMVLHGGLAERFVAETARLEGYMKG
jgi:uncharacterized protein